MFVLKRVYDQARASGQKTFLVERLWPRGVKKQSLELTAWLKDAAPSDELRRWFGHDPVKWGEFRRRYFAELEEKHEALAPLLIAARSGDVVLLYSSRDTDHNNAVALKEYLERHLSSEAGSS